MIGRLFTWLVCALIFTGGMAGLILGLKSGQTSFWITGCFCMLLAMIGAMLAALKE